MVLDPPVAAPSRTRAAARRRSLDPPRLTQLARRARGPADLTGHFRPSLPPGFRSPVPNVAGPPFTLLRHMGIHLRRGKGDTRVAQKVSVTFACDYDSKEIPVGEQLTRSFSLDGREYEIDLCEKHSQKFDEVLTRFQEKARRVTGRVGRPKRRTAAHRQRSADIRSWAKHSGIEVSDRGRIPAQVIKRYDASH
jgi:hypothetical protein